MIDELMVQFLIEGRELVAGAERDLAILSQRPDDAAALDSCFRAIHTLKGSTGLFDLVPMGLMLHAAEDLLTLLRAERTGSAEDFEALLGVVDQVDRWLDVLERTGHLPSDAGRLGEVEERRLRDLIAPELAPALETQAAPTAWRPPPEFKALGALAIRYVPRADSYFSGDDPVAIVSAAPGVTGLRVSAREPWGALDDYDPYACNLIIEAVSSAGRAEVEAAFRFVADQVEIVELGASEPVARIEGEGARRTLRIDAERIDRLADLADDLVIAKNGLADLAIQAEQLAGGQALSQALRGRQAQLDRLVGDLHATVGKVRLVPLGAMFARFPRLVREIARSLDKTVVLETTGGDVEVDKAIVDGLFEPLVHVLRNALDHGVEAADRRRAIGKPDVATIRLAARTEADHVVIEVGDDGAGVDPARVRDVAVHRGLLTREAAEALDDRTAVDLIFTPGFSTAAEISAVSGRGVGMDVVRDAAIRLGGKVSVESLRGRGATIRFVLPVTMVLTKVMIVTCGAERYGLALDTVMETTRVSADRIVPVRAGRAFQLREQAVPLVSLGALVGATARGEERAVERVIVARVQGELVGFAVDAIVDRTDAAVRPMSGLLAGAPGVLGTTLLADGAVLMILDLAELIL
jgi:two-component system chemotaxis sensor kinase CheA